MFSISSISEVLTGQTGRYSLDIFIAILLSLLFCGCLAAALQNWLYWVTTVANRVEHGPDELVVTSHGTKLATIRESDYAALELGILKDWRSIRDQVLNLLAAVLRMLCYGTIIVPAGVFWTLVIAAAVDPSGFHDFLEDPARIAGALVWSARIASAIFAVAVVLALCFGATFGVRDVIKERTIASLRGKLRLPGDTPLILAGKQCPASPEDSGSVQSTI